MDEVDFVDDMAPQDFSPSCWSPLGPQRPSRPWFGRKNRVQLPIL